MFEQQGSSSAARFSPFHFCQLTLTAMAALFLSTGIFIQKEFLNENSSQVRLDLKRFHWLSEIHLGLEKIQVENPQKKVEVAPVKKRKHIFSIKRFSHKKLLGKVPFQDQLVFGAASPISPSPSPPYRVDSAERGKLMQLHRLLTVRLMIALNVPAVQLSPVGSMNKQLISQLASSVQVTQKISDTTWTTQSSGSANLSGQKTIQKRAKKLQQRNPASVSKITYDSPTENLAASVESVQEFNQIGGAQLNALLVQNPTVSTSALSSSNIGSESPSLPQLERQMSDTAFATLSQVISNHLLAYQAGTGPSPVSIASRESVQKVSQPNVTIQKPLRVAARGAVLLQPKKSEKLRYSQYSMAAPLSDRVTIRRLVPVNTQTSLDSQAVHSAGLEEAPYIEAFDTHLTPLDVQNTMLSEERPGQGWGLATTHDLRRPTLVWHNPEKKGQIPLLSNNAVQILSLIASVTQQAEAGIVYGKVAPGWEIDFSGRAERPLYFDSNFRQIGLDAPEQERYFVLLNTEPGSQLVYLTARYGEGSGSIAIPVQKGTNTYVDGSAISFETVSGVVLDGSLSYIKVIDGATVRVVGQSSATTVTDSTGYFRFNGVISAGYPFYIETDKDREFTHRYRVLPGDTLEKAFYRMPLLMIHSLIDQLQGGLSDSSGFVIGAVNLENQVDLKLIPSIKSVPSSSSLIAEAYTVLPDGELQVAHPQRPDSLIQTKQNRFVGVQVSPGSFVCSLTDAQGKERSVLEVASPGVVNVVMMDFK